MEKRIAKIDNQIQNEIIESSIMNQPTLVIAPHLTYPLRAGDSILSHHRWLAHSKFAPVDILGSDILVRCIDGKVFDLIPIKNKPLSKTVAALKTLYYRSHYIAEKFITKRFSATMREYLDQDIYKVVVFSYFWTALSVKDHFKNDVCYIVESINDEVKWFKNLANGSKNIIEKRVADVSLEWVENNLQNLPNQLLLSHLTFEDKNFYKKTLPNNRHIVIPIGAFPRQFESENAVVKGGQKAQMCFVGSLNTAMNRDALIYFHRHFSSVLRRDLGDDLEIVVIGRDPSQTIIDLCESSGWTLVPNATNDELEKWVKSSLFSIIPVEYSTGAKLKIPESLSLGVPILATTPTGVQLDEIVSPCLISDSPEEWLSHINQQKLIGRSIDVVNKLRKSAEKFSWDSIASSAFQQLSIIEQDSSYL
jgi:hypothetical protein